METTENRAIANDSTESFICPNCGGGLRHAPKKVAAQSFVGNVGKYAAVSMADSSCYSSAIALNLSISPSVFSPTFAKSMAVM